MLYRPFSKNIIRLRFPAIISDSLESVWLGEANKMENEWVLRFWPLKSSPQILYLFLPFPRNFRSEIFGCRNYKVEAGWFPDVLLGDKLLN